MLLKFKYQVDAESGLHLENLLKDSINLTKGLGKLSCDSSERTAFSRRPLEPDSGNASGGKTIFHKRPFVGVNVGIWGRFAAHFISGVVFFASYAPKGMHPIVYSAIYNGSHLIPELTISVYVVYLLQESQVLKIFL